MSYFYKTESPKLPDTEITMTTAIDLFAGLGGWSTGARAAGVQVLWAANHWPVAVEWHSANHPDTQHVCQDLHQARWEQVPAHDILLASPCCQGHAKARGKKSGNLNTMHRARRPGRRYRL